MTVVPLSGQVANIWENTQKSVWDCQKTYSKNDQKIVLDGSKIHTQKIVKKWSRAVRNGMPLKHYLNTIF